MVLCGLSEVYLFMIGLLKPLHAVARIICNLAVPPFCAACKLFLHEESIFCDTCRNTIKPVVSRVLPITPSHEMKVLAVGLYGGPLTSLIVAKSWSNRTAAVQLGELVWDMTYVQHIPYDVIVSIPLHWTRFSWRGYNQAAEIAQVIGSKSKKPVKNLLRRVRRTPYQTTIDYDKRHENVKDVFELSMSNAGAYEGKHILLVDDVMTSGATLQMAAKKLLKLKPASITAVVVARSR